MASTSTSPTYRPVIKGSGLVLLLTSRNLLLMLLPKSKTFMVNIENGLPVLGFDGGGDWEEDAWKMFP